MKHVCRFFCAFALGCAVPLFAEFPLVRDGKPMASIVSAGVPSKPVLFASMQLQSCVKKLTGATLPRSGGAPYRIRIGLADKLSLPAGAAELVKSIRDDGFVLYTDAASKTLFITAKEERGLNLGVFELLKTYGGVRWIFPGNEGEFFTKKKDFILPDLAVVKSPAFRYRSFNLVSAYGSGGTWLWMLRNGMSSSSEFFGGEKSFGGHVFSTLLSDAYFKEKPELYCYYKGKRHPQCGSEEQLAQMKMFTGGQANQPCTSNPETVKIMCESVKRILTKDPKIQIFSITNNDSTQWCECENCKKLDPPEEAARGMVSTRFWLLANELIKAAKEVRPDVRFSVSAYQTYQEYPVGVTPHPDAEINMCPHHRCYLHSIGDPKCQMNERYRRIMESFSKHGHKVSTYEYTDILPRGEVWYLPMPRLLAQDLKWYKARGHNGWCDEVAPYDGTYVKLTPEDRRCITERWSGNILDLYLTAALLWDPDMDLDAYEEEGGQIFYGKAWPAMKEYRRKLWLAYKGECAHFCYGSRLIGLGRALEAPGLKKALKEHLEQALQMAAGDKRVEAAVRKDMEFFALTFERANELYCQNEKRNDVIAGRYSPEDPDWDLSDWAYAGELPVKVAYDSDNLYVRAFPENASADQAVEVTLDGKTTRFPLGKDNVFPVRLSRKASAGEGVDLGVVFCKGSERFSWNGGAAKVPDICRKVLFGMSPILKNGSFETFRTDAQGKITLSDFALKGGLKPVTGEDAASGRVFLRGSGLIFQYLNGLLGLMQVYGIPEKYTGKLDVRIAVRGKGKVTLRLTTASLGTIGEKTVEVNAPDWTDAVCEFDCANDGGKLLVLYVIAEHLDLDDIRIEKKNETPPTMFNKGETQP